ncbi:MAG: hypothetical protein IJJ44_10875 [Solobacterium sp.]|nr:hypothetical protein [Solobacterium sp.]
MSKLLKQLLAVALAFQTTLSGISTIVHAEEPEEEPEYTAETVVDEEEETVLEETGDEENVIVVEQEPEEVTEEEEPEITEEPQETETPEVTEPEESEEPEAPEVTEPEDPETPAVEEPEEPEEPEVTEPEETEDPWEEPEELLELDNNDPFWLKITPVEYIYQLKFNEIEYDQYQDDGTYTIKYTNDTGLPSYIVAVKDDVTWFLSRTEEEGPGTFNSKVKFNLPAGQYDLHVAIFNAGILEVSDVHKKLVVLEAPKVVGTGNFTGANYGYIDIDLSDILNHEYDILPGWNENDVVLKVNEDDSGMNLTKVRYYAKDGIFRVRLGESSAYDGMGTYKNYPYGTFELSYKMRAGSAVIGNYVFAGSNTTHADIMSQFVPTSIQIDCSEYPVLYYKGATLQLTPKFGPFTSDYTEYEGIDHRVKYTSSNPKLVTVDSNGKLTAVGMPPADNDWHTKPTLVDITVTSVAYPGLSAVYTVELRSYRGGKSDVGIISNDTWYSPFNWSIGKQMDDNRYELVLFNIEIPDDYYGLNGMPVTFTVDKTSGLSLYTVSGNTYGSRVGTTYTTGFSNNYNGYGSAIAYVHAEDAGVYTVSATSPIGKIGSVKINVDGVSNSLAGGVSKESQFFVDGKPVGGWLRYDITTDSYVYGKDVFKGFTDPGKQVIYYADPKTKKLITGDPMNGNPDTVAKIDGKLYAFGASNGLITYNESGVLKEGWITIEHETLGEYPAYVSAAGEVLTGWVNTLTDGLLYLDPVLGYVHTSEFVPASAGKGKVYVNNYGSAEGIFIDTGATQTFDTADGLYRVFMSSGPDQYFWVKDGAFYTGWLYLHYTADNEPYWNTTKKGAAEAMYFDPNDHGALKRGTFTVGTKQYLSGETYEPKYWGSDYYAVQLLNCNHFGYGKYPEKYGLHRANNLVVDADGAIVFDKMVKIAVWDGTESKYDKYYVYADGSGQPVKNTWISYNGKKYYFDDSGYLSDTKTGTSWMYHDETDGDRVLYYKLKDPKNPQAGYVYCDTNGKKLTSLMVYNDAGDKVGLLDAKGNWAVNAVVTVKMSQNPSSASGTYIADENGNIIVNHSVDRLYSVAEVKGKKYIVDDYGEVKKGDNQPYHAYMKNQGDVWVWPEKNGVLARDTFKTYHTGSDGTFKIYFTKEGTVLQDAPEIYGNFYSWYVKKKAWLGFETEDHFIGFVIPGKTTYPGSMSEIIKAGWIGNDDSPVYLNKDGSIKTGFVKRAGHTRYIATMNTGYVVPVVGDYAYFSTPEQRNILCNIKGKTYFFDEYGEMVTGWVHFEHAIVGEVFTLMMGAPVNTVKLDDVYMYFNDKTGAAVTGSAKVLTPAVFDGVISLGDEGAFQNNAKRVNTTSSLKTLNFDKNGALIFDQNTKIGKKLKEVGTDGVVTSGKPHWSDANKLTYVLKNGVLATGRKKVEGKYYYFDPTTGLKVTNALRKTGKKWYYYGESGEQETPYLSSNQWKVTLPVNMQDAWGKTAYVMTGSTNGKNLTAIWNKDGSLKKIVYAGTTKAAAGESVSFGLWDRYDDNKCRNYIIDGLNGYVLDKKGLPMTGAVSEFTFANDGEYGKYSLNVEKDGKRKVVEVGGPISSLVKIGKKYYVMGSGIIVSGETGIWPIYDWSTLPASEQKSLEQMSQIAYSNGSCLWVMINPDGSVVTNTKKFGHIYFDGPTIFGDEASGIWTINKQGIILDLVAPMYKVGKTTYISNAFKDMPDSGTLTLRMLDVSTATSPSSLPAYIEATIKYKNNKVTGFYNAETGKAINGCYVAQIGDIGMLMWFKNGQPQSGNKTFNYFGISMKFYVDPSMTGAVPRV